MCNPHLSSEKLLFIHVDQKQMDVTIKNAENNELCTDLAPLTHLQNNFSQVNM